MKALLLALAFAAAAEAVPRAVHGSFSWEEPKGWASRDDWGSTVPTYALTDGEASLSVTLYRAGNPLFPAAKDYRAHRLAARGAGEKPRRAGETLTASGKAETWEQDYEAAGSPVHGAARGAVPMRERYALLESGGAFWVLSVKAPKSRFAAAAKAFEAAAAGFRAVADPGARGAIRL